MLWIIFFVEKEHKGADQAEYKEEGHGDEDKGEDNNEDESHENDNEDHPESNANNENNEHQVDYNFITEQGILFNLVSWNGFKDKS